MPEHRKPPIQPGARVEGTLVPDEMAFSIESTTMRLKSLKLRRAEASDKALDDRAQPQKPAPAPTVSAGPVGRVRHDERGVAVWDWAAAVGETAALSATNVMRTLDVSGLSIEQTQSALKALKPDFADAGGGSDPYNQHRADSGDPFKRKTGASGDPYNRVASGGAQGRHPPPKAKPAAPEPKPGGSVLDQLLGKKK